MAICKLLTMESIYNKSPDTFVGKWWNEYIIRVLCWWGPAGVRGQWCGVFDQIISWLMVMKESLLKKKRSVGMLRAETQACLNAPSQSAHEWKLSINKQTRPALTTALCAKDEERSVETSFTFHPSFPILHCFILLIHSRGDEVAGFLHFYNFTPNETHPQWL